MVVRPEMTRQVDSIHYCSFLSVLYSLPYLQDPLNDALTVALSALSPVLSLSQPSQEPPVTVLHKIFPDFYSSTSRHPIRESITLLTIMLYL